MSEFSIYTEEKSITEIQQIVDAQFRLNEVVTVYDLQELQMDSSNQYLIVNDGIHLPVDWSDNFPPYLFSLPIPFSQENLLAIVYARLNNYELSYFYCENNQVLLKEIDAVNCI